MSYRYTHPGLRNTQVDACFEIEDFMTGGLREKDLIIPDCTPGLMFVEKGQFIRHDGDDQQSIEEGNVYIFGQKTRSVEYHFDGKPFRAFGFKLKPIALFPLFGLSACEITDQVLSLDQIEANGHLYADILNNSILSKEAKMDEILRILTTSRELPGNKLLEELLTDIHQTKGEAPISDLLDKYDIGYKRSERLFKQYVGLTPKIYARIIRFNHSIRQGMVGNRSHLTDIAYQSGFFDQTHFIKETKRFTGRTPSELFLKKKMSVEPEHLQYLLQRHY